MAFGRTDVEMKPVTRVALAAVKTDWLLFARMSIVAREHETLNQRPEIRLQSAPA